MCIRDRGGATGTLPLTPHQLWIRVGSTVSAPPAGSVSERQATKRISCILEVPDRLPWKLILGTKNGRVHQSPQGCSSEDWDHDNEGDELASESNPVSMRVVQSVI